MKVTINYITNISLYQEGGGWSGMSRKVYEQLSRFSKIHVIDAVNPPVSVWARLRSKLARIIGLRAIFPAFTSSRLELIAQQVESRIDSSLMLNFFHGSTPWVKVKSDMPYFCYLDASFSTYLQVYHSRTNFHSTKIITAERKFYSSAKAVFFSSRWALERAKSDYNLTGENFYVAGLGGNLPFRKLSVEPKNQFVFIGLDFLGKGGKIVVEAFQLVLQHCKDCHLVLIGAKPPAEVLTIPRVVYAGLLDKKKPEDLLRLQTFLAESKALLLPTSRDLTPLVIIEAGYFGCPSIASRAYGIPELLCDPSYLCELPVTPAVLSQVMIEVLKNKTDREALQQYYWQHFTWNRTGTVIQKVIEPYGE